MSKDIVKNSVWNLRAARQEKRFYKETKRPFRKMILMAVYCVPVVMMKIAMDKTIDALTVLLDKETLKG